MKSVLLKPICIHPEWNDHWGKEKQLSQKNENVDEKADNGLFFWKINITIEITITRYVY